MTLAELHESIENRVENYINHYMPKKFKQCIITNLEINSRHIANEIVARLFTLSFCEPRQNSLAYKTINQFNLENYSKSVGGSVESGLKHSRRNAEKYLVAHENKIHQMPNVYNVPDIMKMENNKKGRSFDVPNLLLISDLKRKSPQVLLRLIYDNRICDSKKASDSCVAEAYTEFDNDYSDAQAISDPQEYIFRWVNYHRLETDMLLSIIPQIADKICNEKNGKNKTWSDADLVRVFGNYSEGMTNYYAYQILTNYRYVDLLFSRDSTWNTSDVIHLSKEIRSIETSMVRYFRQISNETFQSFFDGEERTISDIYEFCRCQYPLIEDHPKSNLYIDKKQLNKPKIKLIRKITDSLLDVEGVSKLFNAP